MERWNDRGAAIIPYGDKIILMRRERGYGKNKRIYYTIPGGGREKGEVIAETTRREMVEELGIEVKIEELLYKVDTLKRMQYIFLASYVSGKLGTGEGEEFVDPDYKKYGKYIPEVVSLEKLKKIRLVPVSLKREMIREFDYIIGKTDKRKNKVTKIRTKKKNFTKKTNKSKKDSKLNSSKEGIEKRNKAKKNTIINIKRKNKKNLKNSKDSNFKNNDTKKA